MLRGWVNKYELQKNCEERHSREFKSEESRKFRFRNEDSNKMCNENVFINF